MARNLALILGGAALVLLGQGASLPAWATPMPHIHAIKTGPKLKAPKAKPPPAAPDTAGAKLVEPPSVGHPFHGLMQAETSEVRTRLGAPDVARGEGAGAMWTYRLPDCALFVFFKAPKHAPADAPARVSGAASGPRVRGQRPLPVNDCIAEAMNRQASGAGGAP
jgi:hypothetical protein